MEEKKVEEVQKEEGIPIEYALLVALIAIIALAAVCYLGNNAPTPEPCISPFRGHLEPCYPGRSNSAAHLYESSHSTIDGLHPNSPVAGEPDCDSELGTRNCRNSMPIQRITKSP